MTTLCCPACETRWKMLPHGSGDRQAFCPPCELARYRTALTKIASAESGHWGRIAWEALHTTNTMRAA